MLPWLRDYPDAIPISAVTGEGLDELVNAIRSIYIGTPRSMRIIVELSDGATVNFIEKRTTVESREYGDGIVTYEVTLGERQMDQLRARGARFEIDEGEDPAAGWGGGGSSSSMPPHRMHAPGGGP